VGHDLTPREVTVVERLALGRTNRQIAEELFLSRRTVDMHVRHILAKLHAANRVEAAGAAQRLGIVAAPDAGDVSPPRAEARARTRPGAARRTGSPAAPAPRLAGRK
jgi:DNA-binding CsgD family transcriptional regulator